MEIPLTIEVILLGAIIAQGIFASALLLIQQDKLKSNRYIALLLLFFALWLLDDFFNAANIYQQNPNFYFLPIYFSFGFGPLIYFYTRSITESGFKFLKKYLVHFIPVVLQVSLYIFLQCSSYQFRRSFWQDIHLPFTYNLEFVGSLISLIIYLILSMKLVKNYQSWINNRFSEISRINLNWLKLNITIIGVIGFLWIVDTILRMVWDYYAKHDFSAISMGFSILVLAAGALIQKKIDETDFRAKGSKPKKEESKFSIDSDLLVRIKTEMKERKYYLIPNFSLKNFAARLDEPARKISEHINHGLGKSFIDFVNEYRVDEFKEQIEQGKLAYLTFVGVAYECGFNSKSTFNRVFKNITGQSPSAYLKEAQNKL